MLFPMEWKLMSIVWDHAPLTASHLSRLAADEIGWKRTTTYTVIARLAERGILEKEGKLVRPLLSRMEAEDEAIRSLLAESFDGDRARLAAALERVPAQPIGEENAKNAENPIDIPTGVC